MRIALLSTHTSPLDQPGTGDGGGLNVYVTEVSRRLAARGHDVRVLTRRNRPHQPDEVELHPRVVLHHVDAGPAAPVPKDGLPSLLCAFAMQAAPLVADVDVMHSHYWLSGWVARRLSRSSGIPFVHTFHTIGVTKNQSLAPGEQPEPPLRLEAERRIAADADQLLALTCGEGRLLHRHFGVSGARITNVPPGVDVELFTPTVPATDAALAARVPDAVRSGAPLVLFVGRLQPLKGPEVAVHMMVHLRERVGSAHLAIVGGASGGGIGVTGPGQLLELARRLGVHDAVTHLPALPQADLAALYRRADVVVVPSRSETFGLVALEAQASGTPVVGSRVGGLQTVIRDGGVLVDGHDPRTWAEHVAAVLTEPARAAAMARAGRRWALASSWDATVDRLERVYRAEASSAVEAA